MPESPAEVEAPGVPSEPGPLSFALHRDSPALPKRPPPRRRHKGPYLPIVYEACGASEFAYEYQHGATSYGAFTYALASILRKFGRGKQSLTFSKLLNETGAKLEALDYDQHPVLNGPPALLHKPVPWQGAKKKA